MINFSNELKTQMKSLGMTQTALAKELRTTQQTISRWLKGTNQPDFETLFEICKILDTTPNEILGWENEMDTKTYNNFGIHNGNVNF